METERDFEEESLFEDTRRISHKMMINYPQNPYDENDSRSWKQKEFSRKKVYTKTWCVIFYNLIIGVL